jgi:sugar phosphate permease
VLAAGVVAQASSAAVLQGLPGLGPQLRSDYHLSLTGLGLLFGSVTVGLVSTLLLWGAAADRFGERLVMGSGLLLATAALLAATQTTTVAPLALCLMAAGAFGASVNAASGRAVFGWFPPEQRGLAMGVRQTALPLGAGLAAAVLPPLASRHGLDLAFIVLAGFTAAGAVVVLLLIREAPTQPSGGVSGPHPASDPRIRRMAGISLLLVVPQFAVVAFLVVYLHDEQGFSVSAAALVLAAVQLVGGAMRIVAGRWADHLGLRVVPLRRIAVVTAALFSLLVVLTATRGPVVPVLLLAGVFAISWNGLAFTVVGELSGPGRAGAALGFQNTAVALGAVITPPLLASVVETTSWSVGWAVAGLAAAAAVVGLGPLAITERPHPSTVVLAE